MKQIVKTIENYEKVAKQLAHFMVSERQRINILYENNTFAKIS